PLAEVFNSPTIENLSKYIRGAEESKYASMQPAEKKEYYALSSAQKRIYILQQMNTGGIVYNIPNILPVSKTIDKGKIEEIISKIIARHEGLRTSFRMIAEEPYQMIHEPGTGEFTIEYYQVTSKGEGGDHGQEAGNNTVDQVSEIINNFIRPFDLSQLPLLRAGLIDLGDSEEFDLFLIDMHHIITDGTSQDVLAREFNHLTVGEELPPLKLQYKDYSEWQTGKAHAEMLVRQEEYWTMAYSDELPVLTLPTDYQRPAIQSFEGSVLGFEVTASEALALKNMIKETGTTLYMAVLSLFNILLSKLSNQEDIIIGSPVAARRHADLEKIIGMFVNTLVMRNFPTGDKPVGEFMTEVKERTFHAFENQEYQFEDLVEKLELIRDASRNPLFDVMLSIPNFELEALEITPAGEEENIPGIPVARKQDAQQKNYESETNISKFDLTLFVVENRGGQFGFAFEYCTKLFKRETVERFANYFKKVLLEALNRPHQKIAQIEILSGDEKRQILYEFNDTADDYPGDKTIHRLIEEQVERTPENIAVVGAEKNTLTSRELNEKSNQLARILIEKGVGTNTIVGIMLRPTLEMVVGIMAILKAGGAYLPVDPTYPRERKNYMLADSAAKLAIVDAKTDDSDIEICETIDVGNNELFKGEAGNPEISVAPGDLIYTIFTSGTTGRPKGAGVFHKGFTNLVAWYVKEFKLNSSDSVLLLTSPGFDLTQKNIFAPLVIGGTLFIPGYRYYDPPSVLRDINTEKITLINCTPGMFNKLVEEESQFQKLSTLKNVFLGGEPINLTKLTKWLESEYCNGEVVNTYGPTECTDVCSFYRITRPGAKLTQSVPIGQPVSNVQLYILGRSYRPVPVGVPGELFVSGEGVGPGYINHITQTREKFKTRTLDDTPKGAAVTLYHTGDLCKWQPDGNIEFLGRMDFQVKIRGFRIELGEIENRLLTYPGIKEAVVIARESARTGSESGEQGDKYLCAYIVPSETIETPSGDDETKDTPDISALKEHLAQTLPDYMIPAYFAALEQIPINANGKIDRKALDKIETETLQTQKEYIAPGNEIEEKLAKIWSEVLGIDTGTPIGTNDDFFQLGGHSLKIITLISKIHKTMDVKLLLVEIFKASTIRAQAKLIAAATTDKFSEIKPVEKRDYYHLSSAQKRLYVLQLLEPGNIVYNMPEVIPVPDEFMENGKLERTLKRLIQRHESLRTSFGMCGEELIQQVREPGEIEFSIEKHEVKTESIEGETYERQQVAGIIERFVRPFNLAQAPLLRVGLIKRRKSETLMMVDMHHIISDGVSHQVLNRDFQALFNETPLQPVTIQYKDFAHWQNSELQKERMKQQEAYWLNALSGELPEVNLAADYQRPNIQSFEGDYVGFEIPTADTASLKALALKQNATLYMVMLALFNILVAKLANQEDIIVGTPVAGRRHVDLQKIIGMFVNTLAIRNQPAGKKTFQQFLTEVNTQTLSAFENQEYQFEELVEKLEINRNASRNPIFDIMFAFDNAEAEAQPQPGKTPEEEPPQATAENQRDEYTYRSAKFDLTLAITAGKHMTCAVEYCTKLFKKETVKRFIGYFREIISATINNPEQKLSDMEILSKEERKNLLFDFNDTSAEYPDTKTIHRLFEEQVERTPEKTAAAGPEKNTLTYKQLNEKSNNLAQLLIEKGVGEGTIAAIMAERSLAMIVALLGILKAGGTYLPIDTEYPEARVRYIFEDSKTNLCLTDTHQVGKIREIMPRFTSENIIALDDETIYEAAPAQPRILPETSPRNTAYIIYTSGTTGKPKGVAVTHRNLANYIWWAANAYLENESLDFPLYTSISFDLTVTSIFTPLLTGNAVIVYKGTAKEPMLDKIVAENKVGIIKLTPSHLYLLKEEQLKNSNIKRLIVGGEELTAAAVRETYDNFGTEIAIYNEYGPTETTVGCMIYKFDPVSEYGKTLPIGTPAANTGIYILDKNRKPVPPGGTGELYVSGANVSQGYLNQPELTAEKFIKKPFVEEQQTLIVQSTVKRGMDASTGDTLYRTGDQARWLPGGSIEFLGRIDRQVKIRGYRIECGEIESRLQEREEIKSAVVIAREESYAAGTAATAATGSVDKYLCAYIVPRNKTVSGEKTVELSELREYLTTVLPEYMIPAYIVELDEIPLTANDKVDRRALPKPETTSQQAYIAPGNEIEDKLADIWAEVLKIEKKIIGVNDNFFELGGHSLKAIVMIAKIGKELNVKLPLVELFRAPVIRGLAMFIKGSAEYKYVSIMPAEKREYYALSSAQERLYLLHQMEPEGIGYNLPEIIHLTEEFLLEKLEETFAKLIKRHESLRTSFHMSGDKPVQRIHPEVEFEIENYEITGETGQNEEPEELDEGNIITLMQQTDAPMTAAAKVSNIVNSFTRPFELAAAPLLRVGVVTVESQPGTAATRHLLVDMHHIISDAVSSGVLAEDFTALYRDEDIPPLRLQYKDYAQWQKTEQESESLKGQEAYWMKLYKGDVPVLNLPTDYMRPAIQSFEGRVTRFVIPAVNTAALRAITFSSRTTLYMVLLALYNILLAKLSSQEEIVVGTPTAGRRHA
ncbi:MAG: amino acid adenylation domain-containing protein, partial [bacterium]|nr:amino acid adenylation domain-containing protein [bacterium]